MFRYCIFLLTICSCAQEVTSDATLFRKVPNDLSGLTFRNDVQNTEDFNIFSYRNFYNGGGVGIADINNDGLQDVFLTSNMSSNKLFLNEGEMKFKDISAQAGIEASNQWSTGVTMIDVNQDGFIDIYVSNAGKREDSDQKNLLYINNQDNSFREAAEEYGLDDSGYTTHATFFDYDLDGDLDVYILNNSFIPVNTLNYNNKRDVRAQDWPVKDFLKGGGDKLLRNDGGKFIDISEEAGIYGSLIGFGLGVVIADFNEDNFPDIYVCNDFFERDYLYINQQDGTFSEELTSAIGQISHSSMGADFGDINNDGLTDLFVTDMLPVDDVRLKRTTTFDNIDLRTLKVNQGFYNQFMKNTLQLNNGDGTFSEVSKYAGVDASDWSWGALMLDADNDGMLDILVCNGIYKDVIDQDFIDFFANDIIQKQALTGKKAEIETIINKMPSNPLRNKFFRNLGKGKFVDKADEWGLKEATFSNGAAYGDLDNDGDLDLVINNVNQEVLLYENRSYNRFVGFQPRYKKGNIDAIGSEIELFQGTEVLSRSIMPARGFQSSVDSRLLFGLGEKTSIDSARIRWPDGFYQAIKIDEFDTYYSVKYDSLQIYRPRSIDYQIQPLFVKQNSDFITHREDDFVDFYMERNIPVQISREGPCIASGDLNGDGQADFFIGSGHGYSSTLYFSSANGYLPVQTSFFDRFKALEDTAAEFVDIDNDGDLDLIVGSGGNNVAYQNRAFIDRLYLNNNGIFDYSHNALPPNAFNTSVIRAYDFNGDGYKDLFVGSRSVPGAYGMSPGSFLYLNERNGRFRDVTKTIAPQLGLAGMITDVEWVDIIGDSIKELVLVGEWMSPKILTLQGRKFEIVESNLSTFSGFWQGMATSDLDQDGDLDLVLGNLGENFNLSADSLHPLLLWINDFDENGSFEKIITRTIDGMDKPIFMKADLMEQIPALKKQNMLHSEYAEKSIQELFPSELLRTSTVKQVNYSSSIVALNEGDGRFHIVPLPEKAQLSSVNEIVVMEVNSDSLSDLVLAGNNHYLLPQLSRLDANRGQVFLNRGKGTFEFYSDIGIEGVVRSIGQDKNKLIFGINNSSPEIYELIQ